MLRNIPKYTFVCYIQKNKPKVLRLGHVLTVKDTLGMGATGLRGATARAK